MKNDFTITSNLHNHLKYLIMKKLLYVLLFVFTTIISSQAQVKTIHDPGASVSVTNEQISGWAGTSRQTEAGTIVLDFEGLGNLEEISQFYNGGGSKTGVSGADYGISFPGPSLALIDSRDGGSGDFTKEVLPGTIMFIMSGCQAIINVMAGFDGGLNFQYASASGMVVSVYDGLDGTGTLLASSSFQPLAQGLKGEAGGYFDNWKHGKLSFPGTAKSVVFLGVANQFGLDDIIIGSEVPQKGQTAVSGAGATETKDFMTTITSAKDYTEKGNLFLAGASSLDLSFGGEKSKHDGTVEESSKYSYVDFNLIPKGGYFFINNLVGGLFLDAEFYQDKPKDESHSRERETTFIIGPFARFYIPICDKLVPYAEAQIGFGTTNSSLKYSSDDEWTESKYSVLTYRLGGGATYFFNNAVGADGFIGYMHDSYKYKESESGEKSSDSKLIYSQFTIQLGIIVILDL
jgi:hypothetical protein